MLILSRKHGEQIVIGDGPDRVTITVVEIRDGKVRLGISCPRGIPVDRVEVRERKEAKGDDR